MQTDLRSEFEVRHLAARQRAADGRPRPRGGAVDAGGAQGREHEAVTTKSRCTVENRRRLSLADPRCPTQRTARCGNASASVVLREVQFERTLPARSIRELPGSRPHGQRKPGVRVVCGQRTPFGNFRRQRRIGA